MSLGKILNAKFSILLILCDQSSEFVSLCIIVRKLLKAQNKPLFEWMCEGVTVACWWLLKWALITGSLLSTWGIHNFMKISSDWLSGPCIVYKSLWASVGIVFFNLLAVIVIYLKWIASTLNKHLYKTKQMKNSLKLHDSDFVSYIYSNVQKDTTFRYCLPRPVTSHTKKPQ